MTAQPPSWPDPGHPIRGPARPECISPATRARGPGDPAVVGG